MILFKKSIESRKLENFWKLGFYVWHLPKKGQDVSFYQDLGINCHLFHLNQLEINFLLMFSKLELPLFWIAQQILYTLFILRMPAYKGFILTQWQNIIQLKLDRFYFVKLV